MCMTFSSNSDYTCHSPSDGLKVGLYCLHAWKTGVARDTGSMACDKIISSLWLIISVQ